MLNSVLTFAQIERESARKLESSSQELEKRQTILEGKTYEEASAEDGKNATGRPAVKRAGAGTGVGATKKPGLAGLDDEVKKEAGEIWPTTLPFSFYK